MEHKTAAMCNDLILTYNKELGHVSLSVLHYKINDVGKSLVMCTVKCLINKLKTPLCTSCYIRF